MGSKSMSDGLNGDGASPGKLFIGGLPRDTTYATFNKHFGRFGEIIDSVIMKDRYSGQPRGFGFITYADPKAVDKVMEENHVLNGKQVEIKRTIPKGAGQTKDIKTKKIFVGGIPSTITEDELKSFFSEHGNVVEHQIIRDHETNRSRGFGFVIFDSEEMVDDLLSRGSMINFAGTQVEIKKAEPKKPSNPSPASGYASNFRNRSFGNGYGGGSYGGLDAGNGPGPYRNPGGGLGRLGGYGSYGTGAELNGSYGAYGSGSLAGYGTDSSHGYSGRFGRYGAGFSGAYGASSLGGYGRGGDAYGGYDGGSSYGHAYASGHSSGYGGVGGMYGKSGYTGGSSRFHPYAR